MIYGSPIVQEKWRFWLYKIKMFHSLRNPELMKNKSKFRSHNPAFMIKTDCCSSSDTRGNSEPVPIDSHVKINTLAAWHTNRLVSVYHFLLSSTCTGAECFYKSPV